MEAKAIRALGLLKDRPLINIAGGCRDTDYARDEESPSIKMGRQIMQIADKYNANVAPPGTQSGFGADISKVWLEYQDRTDHLAETEKAKCFAVSPGGETYYPGNPRLSNDPEREIYAVANMDSILTPFDAGWNWKGARKEDAPYFNHVEYMEAIYERLSEGQKRVMVIGNGGLFTIVEGIAALKNHVPIVITEDTGRFADFVINIFRHFNNDDLLNNFQNRRDEIDAAMLVIINDYVPEEYRKRLLKDFGKEVPAENPEIEIYRKQLYEFLLLTRGQKIETSSIDNLSETIDKILRKQEH